jgi:hypothetical protein
MSNLCIVGVGKFHEYFGDLDVEVHLLRELFLLQLQHFLVQRFPDMAVLRQTGIRIHNVLQLRLILAAAVLLHFLNQSLDLLLLGQVQLLKPHFDMLVR